MGKFLSDHRVNGEIGFQLGNEVLLTEIIVKRYTECVNATPQYTSL